MIVRAGSDALRKGLHGLGGGVEITRFLAEVRYNEGLRNISKNFSASNDIKTRSFALLIGVRFN